LSTGPSVIEQASKHDRPRRLRELEKAFADGAEASDSAVLTVSIIWLSALCAVFLLLCFLPWPLRGLAAILYLAATAQVFSFGRQIGTFTLIGALLYPISLLCFFGLFGSSLLNRVFHRQATWRGRRV
jgi:4,4'-diaponeurosporenoate glycosyltransferase